MARCKSCNAEIFWAKTPSGKSMPVDVKPTAKGNVMLGQNGQATVLGGTELDHYRTDPEEIKEPSLHTSHFATCPGAAQHRKPKGTP